MTLSQALRALAFVAFCVYIVLAVISAVAPWPAVFLGGGLASWVLSSLVP